MEFEVDVDWVTTGFKIVVDSLVNVAERQWNMKLIGFEVILRGRMLFVLHLSRTVLPGISGELPPKDSASEPAIVRTAEGMCSSTENRKLCTRHVEHEFFALVYCATDIEVSQQSCTLQCDVCSRWSCFYFLSHVQWGRIICPARLALCSPSCFVTRTAAVCLPDLCSQVRHGQCVLLQACTLRLCGSLN